MRLSSDLVVKAVGLGINYLGHINLFTFYIV